MVYDGLCWIHRRFQWQTWLTQDAGWCWILLAIHLVWECLRLAAQRWVDMKGYEKVWKKSGQVDQSRLGAPTETIRDVTMRHDDFPIWVSIIYIYIYICFCKILVGPTNAYSVICQFAVWIKSIRTASKGAALWIARECKNQSARHSQSDTWYGLVMFKTCPFM